MGAACDVPADAPPSPPPTSSTVIAASVSSASASASSSAASVATSLPPHIERAKADTLQRAPQLRRHPLVQAAYPETIKQIVESADEVVLYSMHTVTLADLDAVLAGTVAGRPGFLGGLPLQPDARVPVVAWLYDGMTRPFGGTRCYDPHHALRFRRGKDVVAISICFECGTFDMKTSLGIATTRSARIRWDPGFRNYLKHLLEGAASPDMSSDLRP